MEVAVPPIEGPISLPEKKPKKSPVKKASASSKKTSKSTPEADFFGLFFLNTRFKVPGLFPYVLKNEIKSVVTYMIIIN